MTTFKTGDVVRYSTDNRVSHCREGKAIVREDGRLMDTFWGSMWSDSHILTETEIATAEVTFNVADFDELPRYDKYQATIWRRYDYNDRRTITSQHGLEVRYFIRKGTTESLAMMIENATQAVADAESELSSAQRGLDWAREDLAKLKGYLESCGHPNHGNEGHDCKPFLPDGHAARVSS